MPDLIQVADDLKSMPDQWLAQQMQSPSGTVPPWLVASEVQRRQKLRDGSSRAQAPTSSVSQDLIRSLFAKIPPTAGLMPQQGPGNAPPGMPPVNLTPGGSGGALGSPPPGAPPANLRMPGTPGMAKGGRVRYKTGSAVEDDEEYLAPTRDDEMSALYPDEESPEPPPNLKADIVSLVQAASKKYKIAPEVLGSLIHAESSGDHKAVSGKGARGIMQIMPDTAAGMGLKDMSQLDDPAVNIDLGAKYLRMQLDKYGNLKLALAAYNAGPGAVDKYKGVPPYQETQNYTAKILNNVNGVRKNLKLPPLAEPPSAMRSRLLHGPLEAQGPQPEAQPPAPGPSPDARPSPFGAPVRPTAAPVAPPAPMAPPPPTVPAVPQTAAAPPTMPMPPAPGPMAPSAMPLPPAAGSAPENPEMRDWMARQDLAELPLSADNTLSQPAMPPGMIPPRPAAPRPAPPSTAATAPRPGAPVTAPPAGAAAGMAAKPEQLHQVWEPPEESGPMQAVAKQMETMQQEHRPLLERRAELYREQNLKMLDAAGQQFFGAAPDYSKYAKALDTVMALAEKNMHPSIGDSLMRWGMALSASKEHNFGVAAGQAGMYAQAAMARLKQEGMRDYMNAAKAGVELQDKANQYNAKIGQYKMQRLGSQEAGLLQDERTWQSQLNGLQRQYMTLAGNYQKTLDVPREQALAGMAVLNELGIKYDKNLPGGPPAQVARDAPNRLNEVLMAGKNTRGAGTGGPSTTEKTQELRAVSMLAERNDPWNPEKNPADQRYKTATDKLKAKYPVDAGKVTVSASVMEPEDKKRAHAAAQAIYEGNQPPTLTGNSRLNPHIRQILQDDYHMNLSRAALEYGAVVKYQGSLNNPANINYQRNLAFVDNQIPIIQEKYNAWKQAISATVPDFLTRFKGFNRRALEASMSMGGEIGKIANQLNTSVLELQTALPNIYSGGYAPHTEDLQKAEKMLKAEWDDDSFTGGLGLIGELTRARQNAQKLVRPQGVRSDSPYLKGINEAMGGGPAQEKPSPWPGAERAIKGQVYTNPNTGKSFRFMGVDQNGRVGTQAVQ